MSMKKGYFYAISVVTAIPCMLFAAHIGFMMPAGGRQGTTVEVIIGGQAFWNVDKAFISGEPRKRKVRPLLQSRGR